MQLQNPIGFAAGDFIELALAAILVLLVILGRPLIERYSTGIAQRTGWCMLLLGTLPVALRLALLPHHPVPTPDIYDEFGHLLVAGTLRHFRLANPPHALSRFFETFFVLQQPTYSSIYPPGQGLMLALFPIPWAGVLLSTGLLCAGCYWMLKGWTTPGWALIGGMLAVFQFGPLNQWTNSYWGGGAAAVAGCLVFGALPRLRRQFRARDAVLLGLGLAMHLLIRPYESIFLILSVLLFPLPDRRTAALASLFAISATGVLLLQNRQVTGNWTTLPYALSQFQYGVPASLTFKPNPTPHRQLTSEQELDYRMQRAFRTREVESLGSYFQRLIYRTRYYRFYFYPPLVLALVAFLIGIRRYRGLWVVLTVILFALGTNFFPAFQTHYLAAIASLFILMSVAGLEYMSRRPAGPAAARAILYLCAAQFLFWYTLHVLDTRDFSRSIRRYETWDVINHNNPSRRISVNHRLAAIGGKLLIFVRYWPNHIFQDEWVYNSAAIDAQRVVMARDLGEPENEKLRQYYPDRAVWLLEPDAVPPRLTPYKPELPPAPGKKQDEVKPALRLQQVQ